MSVVSFSSNISPFNAEMRVLSSTKFPHGTSKWEWETSTFRYYGPQEISLEGTAVYIGDDEICDPEKWPPVAEKIVVNRRLGRTCMLSDIYEALSSAEARAFVDVTKIFPPDILHFRHSSFASCQFCKDETILVTIWDPEDEISQLTRDTNNTVLGITTPHSNAMAKIYTSRSYMIVMRGILPAYAFWNSVLGYFEMYRELDTPQFISSIRLATCSLEAPISFLTGLVLLLGNYGPMMMPLQMHVMCVSLWGGVSIFSTGLLALYLQEEERHAQTELHVLRRSIWKTYPNFIMAAFLVFVGSDFLLMLVMSFLDSVGPWGVDASTLAMCALMVQFPMQIAISIYFMRQAYILRYAMFFYLRPPKPSENVAFLFAAESLERIGRLAFWLAIGAVAMLTSSCSFIWIAAAVTLGSFKAPCHSPTTLVAVSGIFVFSRITISYAQIQATRANQRGEKVSTLAWMGACWKGLLKSRVHPARLASDEYENSSSRTSVDTEEPSPRSSGRGSELEL